MCLRYVPGPICADICAQSICVRMCPTICARVCARYMCQRMCFSAAGRMCRMRRAVALFAVPFRNAGRAEFVVGRSPSEFKCEESRKRGHLRAGQTEFVVGLKVWHHEANAGFQGAREDPGESVGDDP